MGARFSRIKNWVDEILTAADLNAEFNNILSNLTPAGVDDEAANLEAFEAVADPYPVESPSLPTSLQGEIQRLRYLIKQITGEAEWYVDPAANLAELLGLLENCAALGGSSTQVFSAADGTSGKEVVNYTQLATKAALAGLSTQTFEAANGTSGKQVVNISQFVKSLDTNGYIKLPGGLIIQWGAISSCQTGTGTSITLTNNFPVTFPTACTSMVANRTYDGSTTVSIDGDGMMCRYTAEQYGICHRNVGGPAGWIAAGY